MPKRTRSSSTLSPTPKAASLPYSEAELAPMQQLSDTNDRLSRLIIFSGWSQESYDGHHQEVHVEDCRLRRLERNRHNMTQEEYKIGREEAERARKWHADGMIYHREQWRDDLEAIKSAREWIAELKKLVAAAEKKEAAEKDAK